MKIDITVPPPSRVTRFLSIVVAILIALSTAGQISKYFLGHPKLKGLVPAFYVDFESNVPTWYSSCALLLAAALLLLIAIAKLQQRDRYGAHWLALSALFLFLSIDEVAMIHEYPIDPLRETFHAGGPLYYTWVVPGILFVMIVGFSFSRFLLHLPDRIRNLFLVAGAIFVGGAIGVEMLSGMQADRFGEENFTYAMIVTVEEFFEMLGVVLFIHALLEYMHRHVGLLRVQLGETPGDEVPSRCA